MSGPTPRHEPSIGGPRDRRLRVLFVQSQQFFGADTELHVQLMRYLPRQDVSVRVALAESTAGTRSIDDALGSIDDLEIVPVDFGAGGRRSALGNVRAGVRYGRSVLRLAWYARRHRIDVVHGTEKPRDAVAAVMISKLTRVRSVVHMHVSYGDWLSRPVKWALRNADEVIAVSEFSRRSIVEAGIPDDRVHGVLNALDLRNARWQPADGTAERQRLGLPTDAVVFGVISRLFFYKGHLDLLDALALADLPEYRLVIVGEDDDRGDPNGGGFSRRIAARSEELGLRDRVVFTGFRTDVPALMASFDIYAMPSWEEPFGMVYLEAMAMEKPVVAWDQAGPAEIVTDGETGLLVAPKDIDRLAAALTRLATDADLRTRMGRAGRERVASMFDSPRMCADVLAVYRRAVSR